MLSIITVNFNDSEFKKPMAFAINKLTKNNFKLIIVDNGSNEKNLNLLKKIKQEFNFIQIIYRTQSSLASHAHGEALNLAIKKIKTKYTCVLDGDALPLIKNWDEVMIKSLDCKNKIIGATTPKHEKVKRFGAGEFPMPFFSLFETKVFKDLKIDNKPLPRPELKTIIVKIKEPIYLHLWYWNAWENNGILQFREDIYCLDADLYSKLKY
jgi:glycosyltransferase involved in cell wall biosynthesis